MGDASWIEIVWTLAAVIGAAVRIISVDDSLADYRAACDEQEPAPELVAAVARSAIITNAVHSLVLVGYAAIGVYAMTVPAAPGRPSFGQYLIAGVFLASIALLAYAAAETTRIRHLVREHVLDDG